MLFTLCSSAIALSQHSVQAQDLTSEERIALQAQYDELQKEIAVQQQIIKDTQAQKNTLQGDVTLLNAKIKAAQAQIDAKNITIKQLSAQIAKKNVVIGQLSDRILSGQESLASVLRQTQMLDEYSFISVALGAQSVSGFFIDLDAFTSIKTGLQNLFADIRATKAQTEIEKADLAIKQNQTADAKYVVETQQKQISSDKTQKQQLLTITANQEVEYKKILADRQAKAAAIRAALFPLRDAAAIQFEDALNFAKEAQARTGVRPALILAVLTQESNLGKNVGQCFLRNTMTGAGVGKNTGTAFSNVMAPNRDVPPFLDLAQRLGFDPLNQVVSCPIASAGGWGGAMGPAQFIPSTWKLYENRTSNVTGNAVPNPWAAEDAIAAMSVYLSDLGAGAGGYTAEHRAAAKYYAGSKWATAGRAYGNSVLALAASIQSNIDFLSSN
ncbi:MAG: lytic murein transglycosylase [Candidatus Parcubacteria bacterium]|nr:lytic murein transglycosylase [Candidatus Parcubacteria bacterium]